MDLSSLGTFIGRLHPVLVHLPIGILLLASLFQLLTVKNRFASLQPAVPVMFFLGMCGAVFSCVTGYVLSLNGEYDEELTEQHEWMGIVTAVASIALCLLYRFSVKIFIVRIASVVIVVLVSFTGHLGGSLTHGADYLTLASAKQENKAMPISSVQEAGAYADIVKPILQAKCYSCHGESKQKGKLRLDKEEFILKGGEDGAALKAGNADESGMMERILLPADDKDHMPPKKKPQLTSAEISMLQWWINSGADFNKKVKELPQTDAIKSALAALASGVAEEEASGAGEVKGISDVPAAPVDAPDEKAVKQLKEAGAVVLPVARDSHYLLVNFVTVNSEIDVLVKLLPLLKEQIIWLKLDDKKLNDASLDEIAKLEKLTRLSIRYTAVNDDGLAKLQTLQQLQSLNLAGTKVTAQGVIKLNKLTSLKNLYLYCTEVKGADWSSLKKAFPSANLDSGKYQVPTFANDTTVVKF